MLSAGRSGAPFSGVLLTRRSYPISFASSGAKDYLHVWRVMEVVPNRLLTLECQYGGYPGDSFVTFELTPSGEGTHLKLTHRGLETFPTDKPAFSRESGVKGWTYFICQSLKTFLDDQKK